MKPTNPPNPFPTTIPQELWERCTPPQRTYIINHETYHRIMNCDTGRELVWSLDDEAELQKCIKEEAQ